MTMGQDSRARADSRPTCAQATVDGGASPPRRRFGETRRGCWRGIQDHTNSMVEGASKINDVLRCLDDDVSGDRLPHESFVCLRDDTKDPTRLTGRSFCATMPKTGREELKGAVKAAVTVYCGLRVKWGRHAVNDATVTQLVRAPARPGTASKSTHRRFSAADDDEGARRSRDLA